MVGVPMILSDRVASRVRKEKSVSYVREARELVSDLDQRMGPSPYDIAWMARLRLGANGKPRWPGLIAWLVENQRPDGSWGGEIEYYHDRIICTTAAIIALQENGTDQETERAVRRGQTYLWHHLHLLRYDVSDLVGFELVFPTLLAQARALDLDVPTHAYGYAEIQAAKLRLIPPAMLYSPSISTVYSLEFLGASGDINRLEQALNGNGALGNSPATTAYYLWLRGGGDERAESYLETVRTRNEHVIPVYPFRTFERTWVLNNLTFSGLPITTFADDDVWSSLQEELGTSGVGFDATFGIPDGDTTSVCCRLLLEAGYDVDPAVLAQFEDKKERFIRTYDYERNASVSTNVHALDALRYMSNYPDREIVRERIAVMLLDSREYNTYWTDKWHASPYYATAHALVALSREAAHLIHGCAHTVDWLLHTQREDGSWGFFGMGTQEETAYVLAALLHLARVYDLDPGPIHRGAAYLAQEYEKQHDFPSLWIVKCLYAPYDIIRSAILAALILYERMFGDCP
jgi:halimadienyl-diphosphate synthase